MRIRRYEVILLCMVLCAAVTIACGPKAPEADVDINATVVDIYLDRDGIRVTDMIGGRKYEVLVPDSVPITYNDQQITINELVHSYQIHLWANEVTGKEFKYEAVKIDVIDVGSAAPPRR